MSRDAELGRGEEFDIIRRMRARWGSLAREIGDDAAVLEMPRGEQLVASTDAAIDGTHFRREWLTPHEIGYRAVTAALSDLAAMAATPRGVLLALELPDDARELLDPLADGIGVAVRAAGTAIVGGNIARAKTLVITTTVLGSAFEPLRRTGARADDLLYLTGSLGGPRAALRDFTAGRKPEARLRERFAHPAARIAEARWLATRGAVAAIDVSDGLTADAGHIAAANALAVEIDAERVPVFPGATADDALSGGEEWELLVAAREPLDEAGFAARFKLPLTRVGRCSAGPAEVRVMRGGVRVATPHGYDHFSR